MNGQTTSNVPTDQNKPPREKYSISEDEKVKWFLVYLAAFLALLGFIAFIITKDIWVLLDGSVFAIPILAVYGYYFPYPKKRKQPPDS